MKRVMAFFLSALLSACGTAPALKEKVSVRWIRTTESDVWKICGMGRIGCSAVREDVCYVYAPDPPMKNRWSFKIEQWGVLGHEVKHCFDGNFHD